jgi:hypothetical protein
MVRRRGWFGIIIPSKILRPLISAARSNDSMGHVAAKAWLVPNFEDFDRFSENFSCNFFIKFWIQVVDLRAHDNITVCKEVSPVTQKRRDLF